jgi:hypothetical protein
MQRQEKTISNNLRVLKSSDERERKQASATLNRVMKDIDDTYLEALVYLF